MTRRRALRIAGWVLAAAVAAYVLPGALFVWDSGGGW